MFIGENYKIESDALNITLSVKKTITGTGHGRPSKKSVGEEYWMPIAYFSNVKDALNYLVDQEIRDTGFNDLATVSAKIEELYKLIINLKC